MTGLYGPRLRAGITCMSQAGDGAPAVAYLLQDDGAQAALACQPELHGHNILSQKLCHEPFDDLGPLLRYLR